MTVTIRKAAATDAAWIRGLIPRLHEFGPPAYRPTESMNEAEANATVAAIGSDPGLRDVLVAEVGGTPAGFVHLETGTDFFTHEKHGHVSVIIVAPEAEGSGVGRALLDAAEAWTRERGYRFITLNVFEQNIGARRLYDKAGYGVDMLRYLKLVRDAD